MIVVLDASAAVEVVLQKKAATKLSRYLDKADWVITPTLFISEIANVFWKYQRMTDLPIESCDRYIDQALGLPDDFLNEIDLYREAFKLACTADHPVYDMMYLIAARRNNGTLLTLDKKLKRAAKKFSVDTV